MQPNRLQTRNSSNSLDDLECRSELLNFTADAILVLDAPAAGIIQANETACRLIGHTLSELQALTLFKFFDPAAAEPIRNFLAQQPLIEHTRIFLVDLLTRQGEPLPLEMSLNLIARNNKFHALAIARDIRERRQAMRLQRGGADRIAAIINAIGDAALAVDRNGLVMQMNILARNITGWPPASAIGRHISEVLPLLQEDPDAPSRIPNLADPAEDNPTNALLTIRCRDGNTRRISLDASPVQDSSGNVTGTLIVFHDPMEMAMHLAIAQDRDCLAVSGPIVTLKCENTANLPLKYLSANAPVFLGYSPDDAAAGNLSLMDIIHPDDRERIAQEIQAFRQARASSFELKFQVLRPDSRTRWAQACLAAATATATEKQALHGYILDTTAITTTAIALRESEQKYRSLVEASADAIFLADHNGQIRECNSAACRMFGYSRTQFQSLRLANLTTPEAAASLETAIRELPDLSALFIEKPGRNRNNETFPADFSIRRFHVKGRGHLAAVVRDTTARHKAEDEARTLQEQMRHAQKLESLGLLAGGIAHDFNNLLVAIMGNADIALSEIPTDSKMREYLDDIKRAGQRAAELVGQMLAYAGKGKSNIQTIDLRAVTNDMMQLLRASISKKITIETSFPTKLPMLCADPSQIRQVVMNLITNAADAIGDKRGSITISAELIQATHGFFAEAYLHDKIMEGAYICLKVADTGIGMDPATKERIFDPFFTTKSTGRGLGLSALLGIVRAHHGTLKIDSEKGKGTTFSIFLPATKEEASANIEDDQRALQAWRANGCVLVVDDEPAVCAVAKRMLERIGFTVIIALSGNEALEIFQQKTDAITGVLLDMSMPDMDGGDVFNKITQIQPNIPVVLASGYAEQQVLSRFRSDGQKPAGFVHKPYALANLKEAIKKALEKNNAS